MRGWSRDVPGSARPPERARLTMTRVTEQNKGFLTQTRLPRRWPRVAAGCSRPGWRPGGLLKLAQVGDLARVLAPAAARLGRHHQDRLHQPADRPAFRVHPVQRLRARPGPQGAGQGGLTIGGKKYSVEIIAADSQSSSARAATVASQLVQQQLGRHAARHGHPGDRHPGVLAGRGVRRALRADHLPVGAVVLLEQRHGQVVHLLVHVLPRHPGGDQPVHPGLGQGPDQPRGRRPVAERRGRRGLREVHERRS